MTDPTTFHARTNEAQQLMTAAEAAHSATTTVLVKAAKVFFVELVREAFPDFFSVTTEASWESSDDMAVPRLQITAVTINRSGSLITLEDGEYDQLIEDTFEPLLHLAELTDDYGKRTVFGEDGSIYWPRDTEVTT